MGIWLKYWLKGLVISGEVKKKIAKKSNSNPRP